MLGASAAGATVRIDSARMKDNPTTPDQPPASNPSSAPGSAFDKWLNRGLHQLFDDIANEPIPAELLKLIEVDKNK